MPSSHDETPDDSTPQPDPGQPSDEPGDVPARTSGDRSGDEELDSLSMDAEFLRLVSELDDVPGFRTVHGATRNGAEPRATGPRDWPASAEVEALEEAESHFVPPDPELDLSGDPLRILGWVLVVVGVVGILVGVILMSVLPRYVAGIGGGAVLLGAVVLVWRMPHGRDDHDLTGSDGAVV